MAKHESKRQRQRQPRGGSGAAAPAGLDGVFGVHAVRAMLDRGESPRELWLQEGEAGRRLHDLVELARQRGARVKAVPRDELDRLSQGASHQGVVAFCPPLAPGERGVALA